MPQKQVNFQAEFFAKGKTRDQNVEPYSYSAKKKEKKKTKQKKNNHCPCEY